MSKHTPAPWEFPGGLQTDNTWRVKVTSPRSPHVVANVDGTTKEERAANARLIAAAPEMLEALVYCTEVLDEARGPTEMSGEEMIEALEHAYETAIHAIAKAKGETP